MGKRQYIKTAVLDNGLPPVARAKLAYHHYFENYRPSKDLKQSYLTLIALHDGFITDKSLGDEALDRAVAVEDALTKMHKINCKRVTLKQVDDLRELVQSLEALVK